MKAKTTTIGIPYHTSKRDKIVKSAVALLLSGMYVAGHMPCSVFAAGDSMSTISITSTEFAIDTKGDLWGFGHNASGEVGNGKSNENNVMYYGTSVPEVVLSGVKYVSSGSGYTLAIKEDNSLWGWGNNTYGLLGDDTSNVHFRGETYQTVPKKIMTDVKTVSAGGSFILCVKTDGSLWAWGRGENGQIGDGRFAKPGENYKTYLQTTPKKIMDGVRDVYAADSNGYAIKDDGSLWAWGNNFLYAIGNGEGGYIDKSSVIQSTPVQILTDVQSINATINLAVAVKTDGTLWVWGSGVPGILADGKKVTLDDAGVVQKTPLQIMSGIQAAQTGGRNISVIKNDQKFVGVGTRLRWRNPLHPKKNVGSGSGDNLYRFWHCRLKDRRYALAMDGIFCTGKSPGNTDNGSR